MPNNKKVCLIIKKLPDNKKSMPNNKKVCLIMKKYA